MINENDDEFKFVAYNNRRKHKNRLTNKVTKIADDIYTVNEIINKTNSAVLKFGQSPYLEVLFNKLEEALKYLNVEGIFDIICYGLGNFSDNNNSKYQLAALLSIKLHFSSNVFIYDPLFTKTEIECLNKLDLQVIENNEEGKRTIHNHTTLVFMPHCSKQLLNNFLYANWTPLIHNCILLGNSWSELECNIIDAKFKKSAYYVYKLKPYVNEIQLKNNFEYSNTFSGTSLHIFTKEKLASVPEGFWTNKPKLVYTETDPDFITTTKH